ncbi:diacylglycerol kinase family protein [Sphingobacterium sp. lm-10]|uniref:diacylglycerol kinase n=1 Tax=Sphingobacterium sp. lm-10 TaxID=2944904 RepID=UPI0020228F45|nr:diacylglycerol kinase family protein [Sphingobacterium sp. lm-10]MCL7987802.1 diacylglycerol kinase family protein [Sphingobacterium sp. lm-10]
MKRRIRSFQYAWQGIRSVFARETNAQIHVLATVLVLIAGYVLNIANWEWAVIILCIGLVISMECINSAIEYLANFVSPERNEQIKQVKDVAAAAVLISALAAAAVGILVFAPKIWAFL